MNISQLNRLRRAQSSRPPAARGVIVRKVQWREMFERLFAGIQNMDIDMQNMRTERDEALAQVKRLQQRNLQLWDTYVAGKAGKAQNAQEAPVSASEASNDNLARKPARARLARPVRL